MRGMICCELHVSRTSFKWGMHNMLWSQLKLTAFTLELRMRSPTTNALQGTLRNATTSAVKTSLKKRICVLSNLRNRVYLDPLNMSNAGHFPWSWIRLRSSKRGRKIRPRMSTSSTKRQIWRFHVVVMRWTSKKCAKSVMFWSLNLLFFEVVVVVVVVA